MNDQSTFAGLVNDGDLAILVKRGNAVGCTAFSADDERSVRGDIEFSLRTGLKIEEAARVVLVKLRCVIRCSGRIAGVCQGFAFRHDKLNVAAISAHRTAVGGSCIVGKHGIGELGVLSLQIDSATADLGFVLAEDRIRQVDRVFTARGRFTIDIAKRTAVPGSQIVREGGRTGDAVIAREDDRSTVNLCFHGAVGIEFARLVVLEDSILQRDATVSNQGCTSRFRGVAAQGDAIDNRVSDARQVENVVFETGHRTALEGKNVVLENPLNAFDLGISAKELVVIGEDFSGRLLKVRLIGDCCRTRRNRLL